MRKMILAIALMLLIPTFSSAQVEAVATSRIAWDQDAADVTTASGYVYKGYFDASPTGQVMTDVVCAATAVPTVQTCSAAIPALIPGTHGVTLTAGNGAGDSAQSALLLFTMVAVPATPNNLRILAE